MVLSVGEGSGRGWYRVCLAYSKPWDPPQDSVNQLWQCVAIILELGKRNQKTFSVILSKFKASLGYMRPTYKTQNGGSVAQW